MRRDGTVWQLATDFSEILSAPFSGRIQAPHPSETFAHTRLHRVTAQISKLNLRSWWDPRASRCAHCAADENPEPKDVRSARLVRPQSQYMCAVRSLWDPRASRCAQCAAGETQEPADVRIAPLWRHDVQCSQPSLPHNGNDVYQMS